MTGDPKVIDCLQKAAEMEATLNEQYRLSERALKFLGMKSLKKTAYDFGCMVSDRRRDVLDRLYFLGATPSYVVGAPKDAGSITAIFQQSLDMEYAIVKAYNDWAVVCFEARDDNTRNLFEHWIKWHEDEHIAWLEKQLRLIGAISEAEYISEKM